jgi:transcription antitermination factor NusA-like protein
MIKDKFIWDKPKVKATRASRIRSISLELRTKSVEVVGWFNDKETFSFGMLTTFDEAREYAKALIKELES